MNKLRNQKGFAPVILLLLLLAGVTAGTVVVKEGTNIIPFAGKGDKIATDSAIPFPDAAQKCLSDTDCKAGYYCKTKDLKPLPAQAASRAAEANFKREYGKCLKVKDASGSAEEATTSGKSKNKGEGGGPQGLKNKAKDLITKPLKKLFGSEDKGPKKDKEDKKEDNSQAENSSGKKPDDNSGQGKSENKKD